MWTSQNDYVRIVAGRFCSYYYYTTNHKLQGKKA